MKKVLVVYKSLPHYRVDFFNSLRSKLMPHGIELNLVYGKLKNADSKKKDEVDIEWAKYIPNKIFKIGKTELYWQPCVEDIKSHDLIIVEQANKLLINYYLILLRRFTRKKFAFWGHGRNMQDNPNSLANKFKNLYINQCDWFFAYTEGVKKFLLGNHYPEHKITVVQNAIDTMALKNNCASISEEEVAQAKAKLNISSSNIGLYVGGIYKEKRIPFLLEAAALIKAKIPDFNLIVLGGGPEAYMMEDASKKNDWIHYLGPKFGREKALYFKLSTLYLMPGLVGLGILDSFATLTPMVTTSYEFHSPEIEYLINNVNGVITQNNMDSYVSAVVELLQNKTQQMNLIEGCKIASERYTNEAMVNNFLSGIISCLND